MSLNFVSQNIYKKILYTFLSTSFFNTCFF
uniref:Uncharacterized protein n=1 Tax=Anguilla anguilla TaxID=7936 RepID=A0A0E9R7C6_ANGAN